MLNEKNIIINKIEIGKNYFLVAVRYIIQEIELK
jgi:hypothetical protein